MRTEKEILELLLESKNLDADFKQAVVEEDIETLTKYKTQAEELFKHEDEERHFLGVLMKDIINRTQLFSEDSLLTRSTFAIIHHWFYYDGPIAGEAEDENGQLYLYILESDDGYYHLFKVNGPIFVRSAESARKILARYRGKTPTRIISGFNLQTSSKSL